MMPIMQENPTYFTDKSVVASSLNGMMNSSRRQQQKQNLHQPQRSKYGSSTHNPLGGRRQLSSVTSYEDTEDGSELDTFLSSCESNNSFCSSEHRITSINTHNNNGSLRRKGNNCMDIPPLSPSPKQRPTKIPAPAASSSSTSSLSRFGQLFKKSKSKLSVQSGGSCASSTVESSGIGSPTTCTPDSSLSIYTNSLDGDSHSHSSTNSNQISPKNANLSRLEDSTMEDRFCSTYTFDDCGIFAANMYYNVGEASVFTIYNNGNNANGRKTRKGSSSTGGDNQRDDDEFEDCVQPYYNNPTFSTFPNPKRCSVASAASTTTSSVVPVPVNEIMRVVPVETKGKMGTIQQDRDGYLRPNEPHSSSRSNLRNVKNLYINDSINNEKRIAQVGEVQVDVHTPTTPAPPATGTSSSSSLNPVNCSSSSSGGGGFVGSAGSRLAYHFDSAGSSTSAATTLVAGGGSHNFSTDGLPDIDEASNNSRMFGRSNNGQLPIYMNRAYFSSNSISSSTSSPHNSSRGGSYSNRIIAPPTATSVAADCEPYCSLCASSIMGSPRQRSKMDVAIVKCRECFFSREAETHIRGFFDKLMTEDKQKMDVTLKSYDLKDLDHPSDRVVVHCAKVQIVIISHHFLQRLKDEASRRPRLSPINRVFRSKNVIAVLLAVSAQEVTNGYEAVLPRFSEWFSVDLRSTNKSDPEFCKKFTEQVIKIYNVELSNSSNFSVFPKKVTREQPKVCIIFKKPVNQGDEVRVELRAQRQLSVVQNVKMDNPHTMMLRIPDSLSPDREAIVDISVFVNSSKIGGSRIKSELNLRQMDNDDLDRMVTVLPPFLEWFDRHISDTLKKHYKDCTDYTVDPALELMNGIIICKEDILPTIMHFAAYYGLPHTAFTVLDEADGLAQCTVQNQFNETPSDIAFTRGHSRIGSMIGDYQEISNSYTAYRYIKEIMDKNTDPGQLEYFTETQGMEYKENNNTAVENGAGESRTMTKHESLLNDVIEEEIDNSEDSAVPHSEGPLSEPSSGAKSEDDAERIEAPKPTPLQRRRKNNILENQREYINVNRNPEDNPEVVEKRINAGKAKCPETAKKRLSFIQNYDMPRTINQEYALPPTDARPVPDLQKEVTNSPIFRRKKPGPVETPSGYLIMNEGTSSMMSDQEVEGVEHSSSISAKLVKDTAGRKVSHQNSIGQQSEPETVKDTSPAPSSSSSGNDTTRTGVLTNFKPPPSKNSPNAVSLDPTDKQLIDLLNAVKEKTFDMHQAELLFESWKQRPDVQKSIDEKKEMLEKWRDEYRDIQAKTVKKPSALSKIKSVWQRRKKSSTSQPPTEVLHPFPTETLHHVTNPLVTSPTGITFTGPTIPSNTFTNTLPSSPPPIVTPAQQAPSYDNRISEVSYRTSYGSRSSDSSADSDKVPMGESASSMNRSQPPTSSNPEYNNPMSKRFIPQYISPSPVDTPRISPEIDKALSELSSIPSSALDSYEVPPPPRPVKQMKKISVPGMGENIGIVSPKPPRKPPAIPEQVSPKLAMKPPTIPEQLSPKLAATLPAFPEQEQISPNLPKKPLALPTGSDHDHISPNLPKKPLPLPDQDQISPTLPKKPPAVPAKPARKYQETGSNSPPPAPPPRTNNNSSTNMFSFIDYRKKNQEANEPSAPEVSKGQPYENMNAESKEATDAK